MCSPKCTPPTGKPCPLGHSIFGFKPSQSSQSSLKDMIRVLWEVSSESCQDLADSASSDYVNTVSIGGPDGIVTNVVKQGGIVSVYYLGCIVGCFVG